MIDLKTARKEKGYTQQQLADKAGVKRTTISNLEIGTSKEPRTKNAKKIAEVLGIDWKLFFSD